MAIKRLLVMDETEQAVLTFWQSMMPVQYLSTVNDRLSAAALITVFRFLGAALIRLRRLFDCGAYFKDC